MAGIGALLIGIFLLYFVFMLAAQFIIGQLALFLGSLYVAYVFYKMFVDIDKFKKIYFYSILAVTALLSVAYVNSLFSESACDGYYIGKVFKSGYGPEQNGATVTVENYSTVCGFPGFRHACRQYEECKRGFIAFKPLQLFLFGLFCASLGATAGMLGNSRRKVPESNNSIIKENISIPAERVKIDQINLAYYYKNNQELFNSSTLEELAKLTGRTERVIKSFITKNKYFCSNYGYKNSEDTNLKN